MKQLLTLTARIAPFALAAGTAFAQQATLTPLGTTGTFVTGISHDGSTVSGYMNGGGNFLWTSTGGLVSIGGTASMVKVANNGAAASGDYVDIVSGNTYAGRWTPAGGWTAIGNLGSQSGSSVASGSGISANGQVVVGLGWVTPGQAHGFRWTQAGGDVDLGPQGWSSRAAGISADGTKPVGWWGGGRTACWWNGTTAVNVPGVVVGISEASAANYDGSAVVGKSDSKGFLWTQSGGFVDLGAYPGQTWPESTIATGVSDDGMTVVGIKTPGQAAGWIWRQNLGLIDFGTFLTNQGVPMNGWIVRGVMGISGDGQRMAGWGIDPNGSVQGFLVQLGNAPQTHCIAKTNSLGCTPAITWTGSPSLAQASGFVISSANMRNQKPGLLLHSDGGRAQTPFSGGFLCMNGPIRRVQNLNTGGTPLPASDCSGVFHVDMNTYASGGLGGNPAAFLNVPGTIVQAQFWGRDPGFAPPFNTQLSDAVEYTVLL